MALSSDGRYLCGADGQGRIIEPNNFAAMVGSTTGSRELRRFVLDERLARSS